MDTWFASAIDTIRPQVQVPAMQTLIIWPSNTLTAKRRNPISGYAPPTCISDTQVERHARPHHSITTTPLLRDITSSPQSSSELSSSPSRPSRCPPGPPRSSCCSSSARPSSLRRLRRCSAWAPPTGRPGPLQRCSTLALARAWSRVFASPGCARQLARSCHASPPNTGQKPNKWKQGRGARGHTAAAGLYDTELREKTRFWSASPVFRRCATAALAPLT